MALYYQYPLVLKLVRWDELKKRFEGSIRRKEVVKIGKDEVRRKDTVKGQVTYGADKMGHDSNGVFSVQKNNKNKNQDTVRGEAGNLQQKQSSRRFVALFVQKLDYFKVRMTKDERQKGSEKRYIQSLSGMNGNAQDDSSFPKSTIGEESKSISCLWNQQKKTDLNS